MTFVREFPPPATLAAAGVRVWEVMSRGRGHGQGDHRRRAFMLTSSILGKKACPSWSPQTPVSTGLEELAVAAALELTEVEVVPAAVPSAQAPTPTGMPT